MNIAGSTLRAIMANDFEIESQVDIDLKPNHYAFANKTPMLTEQQAMEHFADLNE